MGQVRVWKVSVIVTELSLVYSLYMYNVDIVSAYEAKAVASVAQRELLDDVMIENIQERKTSKIPSLALHNLDLQ